MKQGTLHCVGVGPGDPELMTVKAVRLLGTCPVIAAFAKRGKIGHAREIACYLNPVAELLRFEYPWTTEIHATDPSYVAALKGFYDDCAATLAGRLREGHDVALLCEGDPFFYGSLDVSVRPPGRLQHGDHPSVTGMSGCWAQARLPITHGDDVLTVLPGTLDQQNLADRLGRERCRGDHESRQQPAQDTRSSRAGRADRARRLRGARHHGGHTPPCLWPSSPTRRRRISRWCWLPAGSARDERRLAILGLGPGDPELRTLQVSHALEEATDLVGYDTYLARIAERDGQRRHGSDNRKELLRARHALNWPRRDAASRWCRPVTRGFLRWPAPCSRPSTADRTPGGAWRSR